MNVLTRGVKNSLRSPIRSGAIVLMFAISIALVLSMLVARSSVLSKINEVKSTAGTNITIRPAGTFGAMGGGDPLTASQLTTIKETSHISSTVMTLSDQLSSDDTSLESSIEFGGFGRGKESSTDTTEDSSSTASGTKMGGMTPGITITGTTDVNSVSTDGGDLNITDGTSFDASSSANEALIGSNLADKNSLSVGDTFTAYNTTFTVAGIFTTDNKFTDSGIIMPLTTLQTITDQSNVVSSVVATVDSSDNVAATVASLQSSLGDAADITSEVERAQSSVSSLEGIASLALTGVTAAGVAGSAIILLAMVMIVRERRREIGVMKAIGGTDGKVIGQFIVEGMTLTVVGAVIGLVLGILVSGPMTTSLVSSSNTNSNSISRQMNGELRTTANSSDTDDTATAPERGSPGDFIQGSFNQLGKNATQVSASLTPEIIALAIGLTVLISLVGTAIPAWFTARIRPAEVLRTE